MSESERDTNPSGETATRTSTEAQNGNGRARHDETARRRPAADGGFAAVIPLDLLRLEEPAGKNSVLRDRNGVRLGLLTGNQKRIYLQSEAIAPIMKQAIIAIEDRRFYTNAGIDLRGIGRALWQ